MLRNYDIRVAALERAVDLVEAIVNGSDVGVELLCFQLPQCVHDVNFAASRERA